VNDVSLIKQESQQRLQLIERDMDAAFRHFKEIGNEIDSLR